MDSSLIKVLNYLLRYHGELISFKDSNNNKRMSCLIQKSS